MLEGASVWLFEERGEFATLTDVQDLASPVPCV